MTLQSLSTRVWLSLATPFLLLILGTVGYKVLGGAEWTWFDALYMSAITLTTVGYGETHTLDTAGRLFTIVFLFGGVFTLFYVATAIIRAVVSGEFQQALGKDRMNQLLEELEGHVIVCGMGRMGRLVCQEFERQHTRYVVIDRTEKMLNTHEYHYGIPLQGDCTDDEILKRAGVERAKVLVTVLPSDADNLYITLTARVINSKLLIIARAEQPSAEPKLRRVGANQIVSPYLIGGHRIAQAVLRPTVGHFLEQATRRGEGDYIIEEVVLHASCQLCRKSLRETDLGHKLGVVVISIKRPSGEMIFNPQGDTVLEAGATLVVVGHRQQLLELEKVASGST